MYGDLRTADGLLELEPFDLVFFLGVLYHSIHHLPLLGMLNRVTKPGGTMLFETSVDPRPDALVRLRWPENGKAKGVPTIQAVRLELAWTGWRKVDAFHGLSARARPRPSSCARRRTSCETAPISRTS